MSAVMILLIVIFSTVLCIVEIPKMLNNKQYRELSAFSVLLLLGTVLGVLKSLDVKLPNPTDWLVWVYSPFKEIMKSLSK